MPLYVLLYEWEYMLDAKSISLKRSVELTTHFMELEHSSHYTQLRLIFCEINDYIHLLVSDVIYTLSQKKQLT